MSVFGGDGKNSQNNIIITMVHALSNKLVNSY